ncbi:hypothetical protein FS749_008503 [Ceratobasidium sp. UAMH 11750]|nr:hypothetical protein FS749_008503 [Ceratobasidium sp. UAMH 11750]
MRLGTLAFAVTYAALSAAQRTSSSEIFTIQPITPINPSSIASTPPPLTDSPTRTSTRLGGSQVQPTSFTTSRLTISDVSTNRPPPSISFGTPTLSGSVITTTSLTPTSPIGTASSVSNASSAVASATTSAAPNTATRLLVGVSAGALGVLVALGGVVLV